MNTKLSTKNVLAKGFSLVEMLVVIAVIGIIAAIAIPSIGSINSSAQSATNQRNAQNICSVFASGVAAGVAWDTTDKDTAIADVITGHNGTGKFSGVTFSVKGLADTDRDAAKPYITFANGLLSYASGN